MAIRFVDGDMFATRKLNMIAHGVNLRGAFGAGVAGQINRHFPGVRLDYEIWLNQHHPKLGDIWLTPVERKFWNRRQLTIAHIAIQNYPGPDARLEAVKTGLINLTKILKKEDIVGLPLIGCGIGGLDWPNVRPIILETMGNTQVEVLIFEGYIRGKGVL